MWWIQYIWTLVLVFLLFYLVLNYLKTVKNKQNSVNKLDEFEIIDNSKTEEVNNTIQIVDDNCSTWVILAIVFSLLSFSGLWIFIRIIWILYLNSENRKRKYSQKCWKKIVTILWMPVIITLLFFWGCVIALIGWH